MTRWFIIGGGLPGSSISPTWGVFQFMAVMEEEPRWNLLGCPESRIFLAFNGSSKTYTGWRLPNTRRHYENSGITLACSLVLSVLSP